MVYKTNLVRIEYNRKGELHWSQNNADEDGCKEFEELVRVYSER